MFDNFLSSLRLAIVQPPLILCAHSFTSLNNIDSTDSQTSLFQFDTSSSECIVPSQSVYLLPIVFGKLHSTIWFALRFLLLQSIVIVALSYTNYFNTFSLNSSAAQSSPVAIVPLRVIPGLSISFHSQSFSLISRIHPSSLPRTTFINLNRNYMTTVD